MEPDKDCIVRFSYGMKQIKMTEDAGNISCHRLKVLLYTSVQK